MRLGGLNMNLIRSDRFLTKMLMNGWITVHFGHVSAINWGRGALISGTSLYPLDGRLPPNLTAILSSVQKKSNMKYKSKKNPSCRKISVFSFKKSKEVYFLKIFKKIGNRVLWSPKGLVRKIWALFSVA